MNTSVDKLMELADAYAQECKDFGHIDNSKAREALLKALSEPENFPAKESDSTGAMAAAWFGTPGASKAVDAVFGGRRHKAEINFKYLLSDQRMRTIIRTIKVERGYRKALVDAGFAIGLSMPRPLPELTEDMLRYCMGAMGTGSPELAGRFRTFWNIMRLTFASSGEEMSHVRSGRTGWPPGLLQDDSRELSRWFASRPESRYLVDQQAKEGNS